MDLKPCPFCGNKKLEIKGSKNRLFWTPWIHCLKCAMNFSLPGIATYCGKDGKENTEEFKPAEQRAKEKLALVWNERAKK